MQDNIPNGRVALNFVVECQKTIQGKPMFFGIRLLAWDKVVEKYKDKIVNGAFVRIRRGIFRHLPLIILMLRGIPEFITVTG